MTDNLAQQPSAPATRGLAHLPLPLFAAPMGLGGIGLAWREAAHVLGAPGVIGEALLLLTTVLWIVIFALHLTRAMRHPGALAGDFKHPIRSAFAAAVSIGLMLIAAAFLPYNRDAAATIWIAGVALHLTIALWTVRGLLIAPREAASLAPPLLIPLVGNILAPVLGAKLGFLAVSWMMFGLGALLWAMIQPVILGRVVTGPPMPDKLKPTLGIFLAPPAVGTLALVSLTGGFGVAALAVFGLAVFVAAVLLSMTPIFARIPFAMSWWGWTFPSAAFALAMILLAQVWPADWAVALAWALLFVASGVVARVALATLRAALTGRLLQPEG